VAQRIETPVVTVAAGVAIAAPTTTALSLRDAILERVEVKVPPGPSGVLGFRILHSGQTVIPFRSADWIIADDETLAWDVEGYPTGSKWSVQAYNTGIYPHSLYFRFLFRELAIPGIKPVEIIPIVPEMPQVVTE
jgi:hypothetical protein